MMCNFTLPYFYIIFTRNPFDIYFGDVVTHYIFHVLFMTFGSVIDVLKMRRAINFHIQSVIDRSITLFGDNNILNI